MEHKSTFIREAAEKSMLFELMEKYIDTLFVFDKENPQVADVIFVCMNGNKIQININWQDWEKDQVNDACESCYCKE